MSKNLSGYLKGHNCSTATLKHETEDWLASLAGLDEEQTVAAIAVDLSKAFDIINLNLLLTKLRVYGFPTTATKLLCECLTDCHQRVKIDGVCTSAWATVRMGMPIKGSLPGKLLFTIYINNVTLSRNMTPRLYADDTTTVSVTFLGTDLVTLPFPC